MKMNSEAGAPVSDEVSATDARETHNWFDSTWELRRGLDVTEDLPLHLWPADLCRPARGAND